MDSADSSYTYHGGGGGGGGSGGVDVIIQDFSISILHPDRSRSKPLLHPINTVIEGGTMFAILGGSGSGKTTLLNVLAGRYDAKQYKVGGSVRFGVLDAASVGVGYVSQQDFLLPCLTVRETLLFAAHMKVSVQSRQRVRGQKRWTGGAEYGDYGQGQGGQGYAQGQGGWQGGQGQVQGGQGQALLSAVGDREESGEWEGQGGEGRGESRGESSGGIYASMVDDVILQLGLRECSHSLVGVEQAGEGGMRGLSGGERRRVSIGVQIIADPRVLCADEPTSGLDAFTAGNVVDSLLRLSRSLHTTVVASLHQPRAELFHKFDAVLLLSKGGHAVYC
ncbi:P-loop containing nucleoside triphosphate hydrolase protein, partial [Ochromonadaceae sp. CCMP2298]